jgi:hypothetical protein
VPLIKTYQADYENEKERRRINHKS